MKKEKRKSGISVVGDVPWGTHLCQFYKTKEDLLDVLVPYFKAGLENNEFCMWVTSEPLNVEEAKTALGKVVKDLDDYIKKGQIEILDYRSWYVKSKKFDSDRVLKGWVEKEKYALQNGFDGLRFTGNTFWLVKNDWDDFKSYEETVNDVIDKHRMIAICSYSLEKCNASEIIDVVSNHQFAIIRREGKWNIIESSERKKAEGQLKNSEELYKNLIELAPDSIVTMDLKGYITSCNSAATHIFSYSKDDLIGKHFSKIGILHVKDIPKYLKVFVSVLRGKGAGTFELSVNDKDGTTRIVETHIDLIKENNKISGVIAITRDITERKQAEAALKESEEKFRTIFENNSSAMAIIERDTTISMVNRKYCEMSLYEEQDVIGKSWTKQIPPEDLERLKEYNRKRLIDPKNAPSEYEFMFYRKDGEIRHCLVSVGILPTSQKIVTSFTDITEHKKAQQEIKSLAKFPAENPNPVLRIKKDGKVVYSNKAGFELLDFWKTNIGEEVPERWRNIIRKMFSSKNLKAEEEEEEEEVNDKILSFVVSLVIDEGYVNLYGRDITERKQAEEALRDSEEKWRSLTENSPDHIMLLDLDGKILFINHTIPDLSKEEVYGKSVYNFIPEQFRKLVKECFERVRKTSQTDTYFTEYTSKDGSTNYFEAHAGSVLKAGKMVGFTVSSTDITERKQAEETLKQKEDYFRSLIENSADVITVLNSNGIVQYQSQNYRSVWGRDPVGEVGKDLLKDVHPDDVSTVNDEFKRLLEKPGSSTQLQVRAQREDRSWRVLDVEACNLLDHPSVRGIVVNFHDITERKQAEDALKESKEKLRSIVENSSDQIFMLDKDYKFLSINKTAADLSRKSPQEMIGRSIFEIFSENIAVQFSKNIKNVFDTGKSMFIEEKMVVQGRELYNSTSLNPVKNDSGRVIAVTGIVRDITERKKAEEALKKSHQLLNETGEMAKVGGWELDLSTNEVSWTEETCRIHGVGPGYRPKLEEALNFYAPESRSAVELAVKKAAETGEPYDLESLFIPRGSKDKIWVRSLGKAVYSGGRIVKLTGTFQNIDKYKRVQENLRSSEEKFYKAFDLSPVAIFITTLKEGRFIEINKTGLDMTGYKLDEVVGHTVKELGLWVDPNDRATLIGRLQKEGIVHNMEASLRKKSGEVFSAIFSVDTVDIAGQQFLLSTLADITERKNAEEEIKKERDFSKSIVDTAQAIVIVLDTEGKIVSFNPYMEELSGYKIDEVKGKDWFTTFLPECDYDQIRHLFKKSLRGIQTRGNINPIIAKDGREILIEWYDKTLKDKDGKIIGVLAIGQDVTERKKTEEMLKKSEERFRLLFDDAPVGIALVDKNGVIQEANNSLLQLLPIRKEEFIGKNFIQLASAFGFDTKEYISDFQKRITGKSPKREITFLSKDNRQVTIAVQSSIIKSGDEKIGILYIVEDITERKRVDVALKQGEEKYRILFNDVPVGIGMVDESGHTVDCNSCMAEMFRMTCEEFKAINVKSLYVNPKDRERLLNLLNKEGKVIDWECTLKRKDGTAFFAILNTEVIERDGQKLNLTTMRDITERKVAEEKIKSQNVQLKKLDQIKTDFLNTTSHELRTPVASIKGYIQMLLKQTLGEITEEQKKALEVLLRNTNRLDHLIQDILDISRLESGTMKFITEKTDVTKMVKEVAEAMQTSADLKGIKIKIDIQEGTPDLLIDGERIKQVLLNLVDNAIKFSPDGSTINVKTRKEKEDILFEVQDFGRGIPKNKQKKIFERFYQVDSGIDRKFGGVGLGLTISKKIIDIFGGQIWVDSTLGKGSSFKFTLPLESTKNSEGDLQEIFMEWP